MNFNEYQNKALDTFKSSGNSTVNLARLTLGLVGEAGEVAEKVKKFMRDTDMSPERKEELSIIVSKELGDVLWYVASLARELNLNLDTVANENIIKLGVRKITGKISGSGDNR